MGDSFYVLGPSHIHFDYYKIVQKEIDDKVLFGNCILDGHVGLPLYEKYIELTVMKYVNNTNMILLVPNYTHDNERMYDTLLRNKSITTDDDELFTDYNTNDLIHKTHKNYAEPLNAHHPNAVEIANHAYKIIDRLISLSPNIKLIFWCAYTRTKMPNKPSISIPIEMHYDTLKKRYANNTIDIDLFATPTAFFENLLQNDGSHPSKDGYILLDKMIKTIRDVIY